MAVGRAFGREERMTIGPKEFRLRLVEQYVVFISLSLSLSPPPKKLEWLPKSAKNPISVLWQDYRSVENSPSVLILMLRISSLTKWIGR